VLRDGGRQSIFLPSVWRALPDARDFVRRLKRKAGLAEDHWSAGFEAYRFSTESFGDAPRAA
jgi:AMMECR1 domain-containing protein